jgi:putative selenium metabolism hydrolase
MAGRAPDPLDVEIGKLARKYSALAVRVLQEAIRLPADWVDRSGEEGGDPACGLSNHEGPRLEYLKQVIVEIGAVDRAEDVAFDAFGNLAWTLEDPADGVPRDAKSVVWLDGHADTVRALRHRWHETIGGGIDPYLGLTNPARVNRAFLAKELGYLPPEREWEHLVWGRGSADQLGGLVSQIVASKILREVRGLGALKGVIWRSHATVAEEDNDGGGPMYLVREELPKAAAEAIPDVVILTDSTGSATEGAVGIYRGQRGRMQIEVRVTGKSCHGSMPQEGRNPLEYGAAIVLEATEQAAKGDGFGSDPFLGRGTRTASWATLESPSDCAVPERFTFRLDRRLTAGEDPSRALAQIEGLAGVARARAAGLGVDVSVPLYAEKTWRGWPAHNPQIYPGWVTPEEHPAVAAAVDAYRRVASPLVERDGTAGALRKKPRVGRWVFSTDGVGFPSPADDAALRVPASKRWVRTGPFRHPAMIGIGSGLEQNTHKIGECVDVRELPVVIALLARFPSLYRASVA